MARNIHSPHKAAVFIAGVYALVGCLWILLSDSVLEWLVHDPELIFRLQTFKGWFYVLVTALLVYSLIQGYLNTVDKEQRKTRQNHHDLELTITAAGAGYWRWEGEEGRMFYSDQAGAILRMSPEEMPTRPSEWKERIHPDDRSAVFNQAFEHITGNSDAFSVECRMLDGNGGWIWVLGAGRVVSRNEEGAPVRAMGIIQDIAERKFAEEHVHQARRQAEQANRSKTHFLASISHELRTPLNGVLAMLQLLHGSELDEKYKEQVEVAYDSGQSLLRIINNLLSLTSAESGNLKLHEEPVNIRRVITSITRSMQVQLPDSVSMNVSIPEELPTKVITDLGKLEQILFNLLGNAIKFTHRGQIKVSVTRLHHVLHGKRHYLFMVEDTGAGIPEGKLPRVFDAFYQVLSGPNPKRPGAGLGLSIISRLVNMMNGSVCIDSEVDRGTTVAVLLPLSEDVPDEHTHEQEGTKSLRVMVTDDDRVNRIAALRFLENLGHSAVACQDARETLDTLHRERFDCVLMDIEMPEINGMDATRMIRRMRESATPPDVPVIAMTAHVLEEERHKFAQAGMDGFVAKPMELDQLRVALNRLDQEPEAESAEDISDSNSE
ncbi:PAS domain-containing hybrid sensor histidine kinase/response regulator [Desulfovibrio oxyclinae]|uniref:PAS domain-containing hybrid sensor histidine kinase/response regulator n=1 Tax=Desulfovibrio oxyclinae TaxID=63560 RepID=UPI000375B545|nr:PAS domain-containing hybrid sensor histidine kinase/response regulator [Desulfovibrio oxyclinae]